MSGPTTPAPTDSACTHNPALADSQLTASNGAHTCRMTRLRIMHNEAAEQQFEQGMQEALQAEQQANNP
ncbi:hypothetical protein MSTO_06390 [Mycobacterium stomatepiae]|uniref:Uncharacterized protein n=1 Tax=Mycobacterium stomatepiae TaxID=470076 RepID=A0A7I7Q244_9MYCO|nr:hypothetical protein MSTO_06390 [Mycobacterium stomatepiae]